MIQNSQATKSTEAKLHLLNDNAKLLFIMLLHECYKQDLNVQISYSYRSFTDQDKIYQQGRTLPGKIISNAKAGTSMHNYKVACDLFVQNGKEAIFDAKHYKKIWEICLQLGLDKKGMVWGGNWKNFVDMPHFEVSFNKNWREIAQANGVQVKDIESGNWRIYKDFI